MSANSKSSLGLWFLVCALFLGGVLSSGLADESQPGSVSPVSYPAVTAVERVFFAPTIERVPRNDI